MNFLRKLGLLWFSPQAVFYISLTALLWLKGPHLLLHADGVLTRGEGVESKINATATNLDNATKIWATASSDQAKSIQSFVASSQTLVSHATTTVDTLNTVASHLDDTVVSANTSIKSLTTDTDTLTTDADSSLKSITSASVQDETDLDKFITAPELKETVTNLNTTSKNVAEGSGEATKTLKDVRIEADAFIAPKPWYKRIIPTALQVGELVWDFAR